MLYSVLFIFVNTTQEQKNRPEDLLLLLAKGLFLSFWHLGIVLLVALALTAEELERNFLLGTLADAACFIDSVAVFAVPDDVEGRHECRIISYMR